MIYRLRKKFIKICMISFVTVFLVLFSFIYLITCLQVNASLDTLADIVSENDGIFPDFDEIVKNGNPPEKPEGINRESPFTTRFFTVCFDSSGQLLSVDTRSIASVTYDEAADYAENALKKEKERGWIEDFRYKIYGSEEGSTVVFINGKDARENTQRFFFASITVFMAGSLVVLLLVILISKKAVRPTAQSYEKQKQFITNANHELKTPLTLIRTNLDILESETGTSEWLDDIRDETQIMTELVDRLVILARMDEEKNSLEMLPFSLSDAVSETVCAFASSVSGRGNTLITNISPGITCTGNEASIRQLVSILMDNAVKYCDPGGTVCAALQGGRHPVLTVDNTCSTVRYLELNRLFDRFYRSDRARTNGTGFGIGLSIAKAITEKHHGEISVQNIKDHVIRFQVKL